VNRQRLTFGFIVAWLTVTWTVTFACSTSDGGDAGDATANGTDGGCSGFNCTDAHVIDPCGDASLAIRARAMFDQTCSGGSETACHIEFAGGTNLEVDRDGAPWPYDFASCEADPGCISRCPEGCGIINVPADQMPDVMLVMPFHPESSYLYWKITGDPRIAPDSGTMPLYNASDPTSGSVDCVAHPSNNGCLCTVETIGPWIEAGCP
jgi:hypothetical protein